MIVVRFKVRCEPDKTEQTKAAFTDVVLASRSVEGVISFDIGQDIADPDCFIATEVFSDRAALDRQEALEVTRKTIGLLEGFVADDPEATIFHVSASEPWS